MPQIIRMGDSTRWSDVVIYNGTARWVEVAGDLSADAAGQIAQVLQQLDDTLPLVGSNRNSILEVVIYLATLKDVPLLNDAWDEWVPQGHAPVRACVQAGLQGNCLVECIISAAIVEPSAHIRLAVPDSD